MNTISKDKKAIALRPVTISNSDQFEYYDALTFKSNSDLRIFVTEMLAQDNCRGKKEIVIDFINPTSRNVYGDVSVSRLMFRKFLKRFGLERNEGKITKILYKSL